MPSPGSIQVAYSVIEHFEDDAPEPFGTYLHSIDRGALRVGDVILLRWLDGRSAYHVKIKEIVGQALHVNFYSVCEVV